MERERPEYLPPIGNEGRGYPWMLLLGVALVGAMAGGVGIYMKTLGAWHQRFEARTEAVTAPVTDATSQPRKADLRERYGHPPLKVLKMSDLTPEQQAQRIREDEALIREFRNRAAARSQEDDGIRCINGTLFRRINGGWENVVGKRCDPNAR